MKIDVDPETIDVDPETIDYLEKMAAQAAQKKKTVEEQPSMEETDDTIDLPKRAKQSYTDEEKKRLAKLFDTSDELNRYHSTIKQSRAIDMSIPKEVKRCRDSIILSALQINKIPLRDYRFIDLIDDIMFLNPGVRIKLDKVNEENEITIDCDLRDLVLPEPFYFDRNGSITNEGQSNKVEPLYCIVKPGKVEIKAPVQPIKEEKKEKQSTKEKCVKAYTKEAFINEVKDFNSNLAILFSSEVEEYDDDPTIFTDENIDKIILPQGFYYANGEITNKNTSFDGKVLSFKVEELSEFYYLYGSPKGIDLTRKGQTHNSKKTIVWKDLAVKALEKLSETLTRIKRVSKKYKRKLVEITKEMIALDSIMEDGEYDLSKLPSEEIDFKMADAIEEIEPKVEPEPVDYAEAPSIPIDTLAFIMGEIDNANKEFRLELEKGLAADYHILDTLNDKIERLNKEAKEERERLMGKEITIEESQKEIKEEPMVIEDDEIETPVDEILGLFDGPTTESPIIETIEEVDDSPTQELPVEEVIEEIESTEETPAIEIIDSKPIEETVVEEVENKESKIKQEKVFMLEDKKTKKVNDYSGYSANAIENIFNSLEAVMTGGQLTIREKNEQFIINDKNLLLKYQVACIWKTINDKLGRDAFSNAAKYEFNTLLVNIINCLAATSTLMEDLVLDSVRKQIPDCKASQILLTNGNTINIIERYASQAGASSIAEIDRSMSEIPYIEPSGIDSSEEPVIKTTEVEKDPSEDELRIAGKINQLLMRSAFYDRQLAEGKIDQKQHDELEQKCIEDIEKLKQEEKSIRH